MEVEIARYLSTKERTETCRICLEDVDSRKMHAVEGCAHHFCLVCIKTHMKMTLLGGLAPRCPQPGCATKLGAAATALLSPRLVGMMAQQRLKEQQRLVSCPEYRRRYPHSGPNGNIREEEQATLPQQISGRRRRRRGARGGDESGGGAAALRTRTSQESVS
jgi:hypothetical protein